MNKILLIAMVFMIVSCENNIKNDASIVIEVPVITNEDKFELLDYSDCFSKIEFISLETSKKSLMGYVNTIKYFNDKLFFLNYQSDIINIFHINGEFISTFNRLGNGLQEYHDIKEFDVDVLGNIHVLSYKSIFVYDSLYQFQKKIPIKDLGGAANIKKLQDDKYLIVYNYQYSEKTSHRHAIFNSNTNDYKYFFQNKLKTIKLDYISHDYNNNVIILPPFYGYNLYALFDDKIEAKYSINFGDMALTEKEFENEKAKVVNGKKQTEWLNIKNKAVNIRYFWDTPKYIFFEYKINRSIYNAIHNKIEHSTSSSKFKHRLALKGPRIQFNAYNTKENYLIGLIYPHNLREMNESYLLNQDQIDFLNSVEPNANPIVVKYYLR
jgi:hypothetical protein